MDGKRFMHLRKLIGYDNSRMSNMRFRFTKYLI